MSEIIAQAQKNRSIHVLGTCIVVDENGKRIEETDVYLCRCGASKNKPFCDGTHKTNGFEGPEFTLEKK
jgi:CDGSH-type Zn-finger protein